MSRPIFTLGRKLAVARISRHELRHGRRQRSAASGRPRQVPVVGVCASPGLPPDGPHRLTD